MVATKQGNGTMTRPADEGSALTSFVPFGGKDPIKLSTTIVQRLICSPTVSGKVCTDAEAIKFIALCKARGLNPFEGDAFLIGYDGQKGATFSLITAHQAFLKRAEVHPEYDGMKSGVIVRDASGIVIDREGDFVFEDDAILGGWATVFFKTRKVPMHKRIRLGTFNTGRSRWKVDPAGMIVKCAEADALRSSFPTMLGGMYMDGELPGGMMGGETPAAVATGKAIAAKIHGDAVPENPPQMPAQHEDGPVDVETESEEEQVSGPTLDQQSLSADLLQDLGEAAGNRDALTQVGARIGAAREALGPLYDAVKAAYSEAMKAAVK